MFAVARLGERLAGREGRPARPPRCRACCSRWRSSRRRSRSISNQLSRAVERRADAFALELTNEPETQIAFQRRIAIKNVSDPDPPGWVTFLLGTHPPTIERIGQAEAAARASSRDG